MYVVRGGMSSVLDVSDVSGAKVGSSVEGLLSMERGEGVGWEVGEKAGWVGVDIALELGVSLEAAERWRFERRVVRKAGQGEREVLTRRDKEGWV